VTTPNAELREQIAYMAKCLCLNQPQMGVDWASPSNLRWLEFADAIMALYAPVLERARAERDTATAAYATLHEAGRKTIDGLHTQIAATQAALRALVPTWLDLTSGDDVVTVGHQAHIWRSARAALAEPQP
jgi:hypothetical protein